MTVEEITVIFGLAFLLTGSLMMARRIVRGRRLCEEFARRLPAEYREHREPKPAFFYTARSAAYSAFVLQSRYRQLPDPWLVSRFEEMRRQEMLTLGFMFGGSALLALVWLWIGMAARG